ncbi:MAG: hypothetical protein QXE01_04805 [Sulfolobales archaeon]
MIPAAASMWSDRLEISARIKTAKSNVHITSYKILGLGQQRDGKCLAIEGYIEIGGSGRNAIAIFTNITPGWYGWVGLVISNDGSFPRAVSKPSISVPINFTSYTFLYGPYRSPGKTPIWSSVDICSMTDNLRSVGNPFPGEKSVSSIYLEPSYKAISWIFINYTGTDNIPRLDISITIS